MKSRRLMLDMGTSPLSVAPAPRARTLNLPQGGPQVLGADLKCSESGLALPGHPKDSTPRYGRRLLPFGISVQLVSPCVSNAARSTEAAGPAMFGPPFQG
jgi:hypothetical protein